MRGHKRAVRLHQRVRTLQGERHVIPGCGHDVRGMRQKLQVVLLGRNAGQLLRGQDRRDKACDAAVFGGRPCHDGDLAIELRLTLQPLNAHHGAPIEPYEHGLAPVEYFTRLLPPFHANV
eukprot:scaffold37881_cov69-Phaeocystis_antarctica.AAC.2